jgi:hypothetical protein
MLTHKTQKRERSLEDAGDEIGCKAHELLLFVAAGG